MKKISLFALVAVVAVGASFVSKAEATEAVGPSISSVFPEPGNYELPVGKNFVLEVLAQAGDAQLYSLEVDHSMENDFPEFTLYASESNVCGDETCTGFTTKGVTPSYDDGKWTIDFGPVVTKKFVENGGITFYLVAKDVDGVESGSMSSTTEDNTYKYELIYASEALVKDQGELETALANENITTITFGDSFIVDTQINITRDVTIDGNGHTLSRVSSFNKTQWASGNAYVLGVHKKTVTLKNISLSGANAGLLVNGSNVTLEGNIDVSGNGFGGIEVSKGVNVPEDSTLNIDATLVNTTEAYGLPTVWIDKEGESIDGSGQNSLSEIEEVKENQKQYYLRSVDVYTNTQLNAALSNSNVSNINIVSDMEISSQVAINRAGVTINGNDHTLTAAMSSDDSSVILISGNGNDVTINNLVVDGGNQGIHGIQVYVVTGINLDTVTVQKAGKSGILVNGSTVTVNNVTTKNNTWGGINVDQGTNVTSPATLTVLGTSTHVEEGYQIWKDDNTKTDVTVSADKYSSQTYTKDGVIGTFYTLTPVSTGGGNTGGSSSSTSGGRGGSSFVTPAPVAEVPAVDTGLLAVACLPGSGDTFNIATGEACPVVIGQVLGAESYNFSLLMKVGSRGAEVTQLQMFLNNAGFNSGVVDGIFGNLTKAAVMQYQASLGLSADGIVGPITRAALNA